MSMTLLLRRASLQSLTKPEMRRRQVATLQGVSLLERQIGAIINEDLMLANLLRNGVAASKPVPHSPD